MHAVSATHTEARDSMELSLRWANAQSRRTVTARRRCLASCKVACTKTYAIAAWSPWSRWALTDARSAACRSASPRTKCSRSCPTPRRNCRLITRAMSWAWVSRDLVEGVRRGVDMFDCVMPSRNARNGHLFVDTGVVKIKTPNGVAQLSPGCHLRLLHLQELQRGLPLPSV